MGNEMSDLIKIILKGSISALDDHPELVAAVVRGSISSLSEEPREGGGMCSTSSLSEEPREGGGMCSTCRDYNIPSHQKQAPDYNLKVIKDDDVNYPT